MMDRSEQVAWSVVRNKLKSYFGQDLFNSWFKNMSFSSIEGDTVLLKVNNKFTKTWIESNYCSHLRDFWKSVENNVSNVRLICDDKQPSIRSAQPEQKIEQKTVIGNKRFDNFITSESNKLAFSMINHLITQPSRLNPLLIIARSGDGKTHLANAIINHCRESNKPFLYYSGSDFVNRFDYSATDKFLVVVDDFHILQKQDDLQEKACAVLDHCIHTGKQLILFAKDVSGISEDMLDKLSAGMSVRISSPDLMLAKSLVRKCLSSQSGISADKSSAILDKITFLIAKAPTSARSIISECSRLQALFSIDAMENENSYLKLVSQLGSQNNEVDYSIEEIKRNVAKYFKVSIPIIFSKNATRLVSQARQVLVYLAKNYGSYSTASLAKLMSKANSTISYSVGVVKKSDSLMRAVNEIINMIRD